MAEVGLAKCLDPVKPQVQDGGVGGCPGDVDETEVHAADDRLVAETSRGAGPARGRQEAHEENERP